MNTFHTALAGVLSLSLSAAAPAAPVPFTDYADFYRSLGGNLFPGAGTPLALPCAESPRHCIWVTSMRQALRRYDQPLWTTPGDLTMSPPKGTPDVAFDGQAVMVGARRWPLGSAVSPGPERRASASHIHPESVSDVIAWQRGSSVCLDVRHAGSGTSDRYTTVLLLHSGRLYILPPLFGTCAAVRQAPRGGFSYPSNTYLGQEQENHSTGLQVDYLLSDGSTRIARYLLHFSDPGYPFSFEASLDP
jgi:hypothetical protein